jgi:hypothetical protein
MPSAYRLGSAICTSVSAIALALAFIVTSGQAQAGIRPAAADTPCTCPNGESQPCDANCPAGKQCSNSRCHKLADNSLVCWQPNCK